jgi:hypothetical protein
MITMCFPSTWSATDCCLHMLFRRELADVVTHVYHSETGFEPVQRVYDTRRLAGPESSRKKATPTQGRVDPKST